MKFHAGRGVGDVVNGFLVREVVGWMDDLHGNLRVEI